jgi:L-aminopeptidase/D-esterase-like protein
MLKPGPRNLITDVDGILVGNAEDHTLRSGVSVVVCETPSVASVDVRGGAPGTRETDLLDPSCTVDRIDAVCLSGGSAFGLSSADGVMRWMKQHGKGVAIADIVVPIVPTAILFDLLNGGDKIPSSLIGRRARRHATSRWATLARASAPRPAISRAVSAAPRRSIRRPAFRWARSSR